MGKSIKCSLFWISKAIPKVLKLSNLENGDPNEPHNNTEIMMMSHRRSDIILINGYDTHGLSFFRIPIKVIRLDRIWVGVLSVNNAVGGQ